MKKLFVLYALPLFLTMGCVCRNVLPPGASSFQGFNEVARFARWAQAVYSSDDSLRMTLTSFDTVAIINVSKTQGRFFWAFRASDSVQLIGCRGTDNLNNAVSDANALLEYSEAAAVKLHRGFLESSEDAYPPLRDLLRKEARIWLTGHSLGGAQAVVLAMILKNAGFQVEKVVTFGQPKVTDASGAEAWHKLPLTRFIHQQDVVPLVPPQGCILFVRTGFYHFGESVTLLGQGQYSRSGQGCSADRREAEFWKGLVSATGAEKPVVAAAQYLGDQVPDHFMAGYISAIDSLVMGSVEVPCR